jgi:hypothetical protein
MKPTELRIGNWVNGEFANGELKPFQIFRIDGNDKMEGLQPIPLTTEILNSCIYYDGSEWCLLNHTAWSIQEYGGRFGLAYGGDLSKETWVDHLHQLQNLYYALTGKELEINL